MTPSGDIHFIGGPLDGFVCGLEEWPPPETLVVGPTLEEGAKAGRYVRTTYSTLPDEAAAHPNITHAGRYRWEPADVNSDRKDIGPCPM